MRNKLIVGMIIALVVVGGIWYFTTSNQQELPLETTKVKIANLPVVQGLPLYLAIDKGYFKNAGLNVELVKFEAPNQIIDALMQGQVDLTSPSGAMGITGIADFKNPGKLKIYAGAGGDKIIQSDAILIKNDSAIKSIADLKGKKLGVVAGSIQWQTIAREILAQNGLAADKDVTLVDLALGVQVQTLAAGQVDAILTLEPIPTIVKAKNIGRELVDHVGAKYIANPLYVGAGIVSVAFAEKNPVTTTKILKILQQAIAEINQNPDTARQYLKGYTALDDATIAQVPIPLLKFYTDFTASDITATQKFYDIFTKFKVVDGQINFSNLIYSPQTK